MTDMSSNPRYSAAPSLLTKVNASNERSNIERGHPDGDEGKLFTKYLILHYSFLKLNFTDMKEVLRVNPLSYLIV